MQLLLSASLFPLLSLALPSTLHDTRQTNTTYDPTNQEIGTIVSSAPFSSYIVSSITYDPSIPYGQDPIVGLSYSDGTRWGYGLQYSVRDGKVRGGSPYGGEIWFLAPASTALVNHTDAAGASGGFTYGEDNVLRYLGDATSWFACSSLHTDGSQIVYLQIDGVVPTDGDCEEVTLMGGNSG